MTKALHLDERFGLHERAISASLKLLNEHQHWAPSIEAIAAEMQVNPAELQQTFHSSADVLNAAAEQALIRLVDRATKAMISLDQDDYIGQFHALGMSYLEWADEFPQHFLLIVDRKLVDPDHNPALNRYRKSIIELVRKILARARDTGALHPDEDIEQLLMTSMAFVQSLGRNIVTSPNLGEAELKAAQSSFTDYLLRSARGASKLKKIARHDI